MRIFQVGLMTGAYVSTQSYAIEIVGKDYKPMVACMICGIPSSIGYIAMAFRNFASNICTGSCLPIIGALFLKQ